MRKRWRIDPKKSAMENLFDACRVAALAHKGHYAQKVVLMKDEWDDILDTAILHAVELFLDSKIRRHTYCHEVSFFTNVWSCVWSCFNCELNKYVKNVVKRKINSLDRLEPDTAQYLANTARPPIYTTTKFDYKGAQSNLRTWLKRSTNEAYLQREDEDDFWSYMDACEEYGLTPDKNAPLYKRGRWI